MSLIAFVVYTDGSPKNKSTCLINIYLKQIQVPFDGQWYIASLDIKESWVKSFWVQVFSSIFFSICNTISRLYVLKQEVLNFFLMIFKKVALLGSLGCQSLTYKELAPKVTFTQRPSLYMPVTRLLLMTSLIREVLKVLADLIFNLEMTAAAAAAAGTEVKYNSRKTD